VAQFFKRAQQRSPNEDPHDVFDRVDTDKSGGLSTQEMRAYYKDTQQSAKEFMEQRKKNPNATKCAIKLGGLPTAR
jgi:Ca2+-binding EF-hand superfamily protein